MFPCGPAHVEELARTAQTRVYVQEGVARGCHRGRRSIALGDGKRIAHVYMAGRFTALRRTEAYGESLRIYDLRARRTRGEKARVRRFTDIVVDSRGVAAHLSYRLQDGALELNDSDGGYYGFGYEPGFLAFKGTVIATRDGAGYGFAGLDWDSRRAREGTLVSHGAVRVEVSRGSRLTVRRGDDSPLKLGDAIGPCASPSTCSGIGAVQITADRFVASHWATAERGGEDVLTVHDLDTRRQRRPCPIATRFVLGESGRVACSYRSPAGAEVAVEGVVLDQGTDVEPDSLVRRGDQIVWRRGGVERTAPLP